MVSSSVQKLGSFPVHRVGPDFSPSHLFCSSPLLTGVLLKKLSSQGICIYWSFLLGYVLFPDNHGSLPRLWITDEIACPPGLPWPAYFKWNLPVSLPASTSFSPSLLSLTSNLYQHPSHLIPSSSSPRTSFSLPLYLHPHHQEKLSSVASPLHSVRAGTLTSFANHYTSNTLDIVGTQ